MMYLTSYPWSVQPILNDVFYCIILGKCLFRNAAKFPNEIGLVTLLIFCAVSLKISRS